MMTNWKLIETENKNDSIYDLYLSNHDSEKNYMIRVDGIELMNSLQPQSEYVLGKLAVDYCKNMNGSILIGGLGIGFTLSEVINQITLQNKFINVIVSEISNTVIHWFNKYFNYNIFNINLNNVKIKSSNVFDLIKKYNFDVICLDVDNGPSYLSLEDNHIIYKDYGLKEIYKSLNNNGTCLIWSAYKENTLIDIAQRCNFIVHETSVKLNDVSISYTQYIYILIKKESNES